MARKVRVRKKRFGSRDSALEKQLQEFDRRISGLENQVAKILEILQIVAQASRLRERENGGVGESAGAGERESGGKTHDQPLGAADKMQLIAQLVEEEEKNYKADEQQLNDCYIQAQHWAHRGVMLFDAIASTMELCQNKLFPEDRKVKNELPVAVQEKLQKRYEGIEIIGRMLARLVEPARELCETETPNRHLPRVSKPELIDVLSNETNQESAHQAIAKKLKEIGDRRYKCIAEIRELAERRQQRWLNFVEKKVLPIVDGIESGQRYSQPLVNQLKDENPTWSTKLDDWFKIYHNLHLNLLHLLEQVQVYPMQVKTKTLIDYTRHEPFDLQADESLPNEYIKEVIRQGYEYLSEKSKVKSQKSKEFLVLRTAQVVVVKN
ncbi:nucleotide exchange factor GrpE [Aerosakkonema funiforme]|uniref:nucleotide exchange factor GrpE n=1 Tax=Aerosakkonema funiforme TaxID=1246630 RepID=UPI0035BA5303